MIPPWLKAFLLRARHGQREQDLAASMEPASSMAPMARAQLLGNKIGGWAIHPEQSNLTVEVWLDGAPIGSVMTLLERQGVAERFGEQYRRSGYEFVFPDSCCDAQVHEVNVRVRGVELKIPGFPTRHVLNSPVYFSDEGREWVLEGRLDTDGEVDVFLDDRKIGSSFGREGFFEFCVPDAFRDNRHHDLNARVAGLERPVSGFPRQSRLPPDTPERWDRVKPLCMLLEERHEQVELLAEWPEDAQAYRWLRRKPLGFDSIPETWLAAKSFQLEGQMIAHPDRLILLTEPYVIRDGPVVLNDGTVLEESITAAYTTRPVVEPELYRMMKRGDVPRIQGCSAYVQRFGIRNYYHCCIEMLPKLGVLEECCDTLPEQACFLVADKRVLPGFLTRELSILLPESMEARFLEDRVYRFERLLIPVALHNKSQEKSRLQHSTLSLYSRRRRELGLDRPWREAESGLKLFISRADAKHRRILNEHELISALEPLGVQKVVCTQHEPTELRTLFEAADVVIGMHGANLSDLVYCRPGTLIISLLPERFYPHITCYWDLADFFQLEFGVVPIEDSGYDRPAANRGSGDLPVDIGRVVPGILQAWNESQR